MKRLLVHLSCMFFSVLTYTTITRHPFLVFATTAANGKESSYAIYYDKKRQTYLGDVYSVKWMENSDTADLHSETLEQQFGE